MTLDSATILKRVVLKKCNNFKVDHPTQYQLSVEISIFGVVLSLPSVSPRILNKQHSWFSVMIQRGANLFLEKYLLPITCMPCGAFCCCLESNQSLQKTMRVLPAVQGRKEIITIIISQTTHPGDHVRTYLTLETTCAPPDEDV